MARLDKPSRELLTAEDFESYPVWVWDDRNDACLPLDDVSPAYGQWDPMFIAASITAGKAHLKGYVVGDGLNVYAFAVFFGTAEFSFNLNMGEDFFVELRRLAAEVGCKEQELLPLHYDSPVRLGLGGLICDRENLP